MTTRRRPSARLLAVVAVAGLALAGAACSDDGDDDGSPTTTTAPSTTAGEPGGSTTTGDGTDEPSTTEGTTTTTEAAPDGPLADRLPEIPGYRRTVDDQDDLDFEGELCDGSTPSALPVEVGGVEYEHEADDGPSFDVGGLRFASEDDAATFYDEFASTTAGCESPGITVDAGTPSSVGDEGLDFTVTIAGDEDDPEETGLIHLARAGDEVWLLSQEDASAPEDLTAPVVDAFTTVVGG